MADQEMRWVINDKKDTVSETVAQLRIDHPDKSYVIGDPQETAIFSLEVMKRIGLVGIYELTRQQ